MLMEDFSIEIRKKITTANCKTDTTLKKGLGFVGKNKWDIKWSQVDVDDNKIKITLDTIPRKYGYEQVEEFLGIKGKGKNERITGFYIKQTEKDIPHHDAVVITIYEKDLNQFPREKLDSLLGFIERVVGESSFKTISSR